MLEVKIRCSKCQCIIDNVDTKIFAGDVHVYVDPCSCVEDDMKELSEKVSGLESENNSLEQDNDKLVSQIIQHEKDMLVMEAVVKELQAKLNEKQA